jgi:hypothetical protein
VVRRLVAASLGCALAVAAVLVGCSPERSRGVVAPVVAKPSRIAFSFGGRIHVMRPDGTGRVRLTGGRFGRDDDAVPGGPVAASLGDSDHLSGPRFAAIGPGGGFG